MPRPRPATRLASRPAAAVDASTARVGAVPSKGWHTCHILRMSSFVSPPTATCCSPSTRKGRFALARPRRSAEVRGRGAAKAARGAAASAATQKYDGAADTAGFSRAIAPRIVPMVRVRMLMRTNSFLFFFVFFSNASTPTSKGFVGGRRYAVEARTTSCDGAWGDLRHPCPLAAPHTRTGQREILQARPARGHVVLSGT